MTDDKKSGSIQTVYTIYLDSREYGRSDVTLITWHLVSAKVGTNFVDKRRSLGRYSSLADWGHEVQF
jgi:hypothetical protein